MAHGSSEYTYIHIRNSHTRLATRHVYIIRIRLTSPASKISSSGSLAQTALSADCRTNTYVRLNASYKPIYPVFYKNSLPLGIAIRRVRNLSNGPHSNLKSDIHIDISIYIHAWWYVMCRYMMHPGGIQIQLSMSLFWHGRKKLIGIEEIYLYTYFLIAVCIYIAQIYSKTRALSPIIDGVTPVIKPNPGCELAFL
jgi:hypothetical protein